MKNLLFFGWGHEWYPNRLTTIMEVVTNQLTIHHRKKLLEIFIKNFLIGQIQTLFSIRSPSDRSYHFTRSYHHTKGSSYTTSSSYALGWVGSVKMWLNESD